VSSLAELATGARSTIGRYFNLVSAVPSAMLVAFVFLLVSSGAWSGQPNASRAFHAVSGINLGTVAALSAAAFTVGLAIHPLQFALVQFYEGYWGDSEIAQRAWLARAVQHHERALHGRTVLADLRDLDADQPLPDWHYREHLWRFALRMSAGRINESYASFSLPDAVAMPTRLGNVLRRYELSAGAAYGLDAARVVPFLALVAPEEDVKYLDDQRWSLDLAVRLSATSLLATLVAVVFLWNDGLWLLLALVPYGLAYLFYCGAVVVAHEYGAAMAALIALNRFALYDRLKIASPANSADERTTNTEQVGRLFHLGSDVQDATLDYPAPEPAEQTFTLRLRPGRRSRS
jgi:hypothetical protein